MPLDIDFLADGRFKGVHEAKDAICWYALAARPTPNPEQFCKYSWGWGGRIGHLRNPWRSFCNWKRDAYVSSIGPTALFLATGHIGSL